MPQAVAPVLPPAPRDQTSAAASITLLPPGDAAYYTLSYHLLTLDGTELTHGTVGYGRRIGLPAGSYKLKIDAIPAIEKELVVESGAALEVRLRQGYSGWVAEVGIGTPEQGG